jgi:HD-GYP domain-containing protein (c-di-GMP phosphodiesterase class II)
MQPSNNQEFQQSLKAASLSITRRGLEILRDNPDACRRIAGMPFPDYIPALACDLQTPELKAVLTLARQLFGEYGQYLQTMANEALRDMFHQCLRQAAASRWESAGVGDHPCRVAQIAVAVGEQLRFTSLELDEIQWGGLLHDIGKLFIDNLASTLEEMQIDYDQILSFVRTHATLGGLLLESVFPLFPTGMMCAYQHQESVDGSGYPFGLRYEQLTVESQIVNLADGYDATVTRSNWSLAQVCDQNRQMYEKAGYPDATVLQAFLQTIERFHTEWYMKPLIPSIYGVVNA